MSAHQAAAKEEHDAVVAAGGLHIIGTERHETRRVDNQLRGRAGRQGDPGDSRFYLSLEDDLMRIFAREWVSTLLQRMGMEEGVPIESEHDLEPHRGRAEGGRDAELRVPQARARVRRRHEQAARGRLRAPPPAHDRRRPEAAHHRGLRLHPALEHPRHPRAREGPPRRVEGRGAVPRLFDQFGAQFDKEINIAELNRHELGETIFEKLRARYDGKEAILGPQAMRYHERVVMLSVLDGLWKDHLLAMDHLKEGIGLRGYAQQDPLVAYKKESFEMFEGMMLRFQEDTVRHLFRMQIIGPDGSPIDTEGPLPPWMQSQQQLDLPAEPVQVRKQRHNRIAPPHRRRLRRRLFTSGPNPLALDHHRRPRARVPEEEAARDRPRAPPVAAAETAANGGHASRHSGAKVGRNDDCPCGSGKKYKKCHGAQAWAYRYI